MNIELEYPWLLILMILPYFIYRFFPSYLQPSVSIYIPFFDRIVDATGQTPSAGSTAYKRQRIQSIALVLFWIGLVLSVARPVFLGEVEVTEKAGRDLMIAVDLSQSMEQKDYFVKGDLQQAISRIEALKSVLTEFAKEREGDRLGLIVFGSGAYLQIPFTEDLSLWGDLLHEMDTQLAGPATAIGDAIGLTIRAFSESDSKQRLLLLVTDGSDTSSRLNAVDAARVAATDNIQIYTLGMGDPKTQGDDKVDFASLDKIARVSKGKSYVAADSDSLEKVLADINDIAPATFEQQSFQPKTDLYPWLIGPLLLFYLLVWMILAIQNIWMSRKRRAHV